jgi:hypothetical protein
MKRERSITRELRMVVNALEGGKSGLEGIENGCVDALEGEKSVPRESRMVVSMPLKGENPTSRELRMVIDALEERKVSHKGTERGYQCP